jgi:isoleucyl-tRNA synthetase
MLPTNLNMETVWWILKQIYNRFDVQRLHHSAVFSKKRTGLSSHEVNQPGSYRDVTDTTVVAQFTKRLRLLYQLL